MNEFQKELKRCENEIHNLRHLSDDRIPFKDVLINFRLVGRRALKLESLINIASMNNITTRQILEDIFSRGIEKEFEYWHSKQASRNVHI